MWSKGGVIRERKRSYLCVFGRRSRPARGVATRWTSLSGSVDHRRPLKRNKRYLDVTATKSGRREWNKNTTSRYGGALNRQERWWQRLGMSNGRALGVRHPAPPSAHAPPLPLEEPGWARSIIDAFVLLLSERKAWKGGLTFRRHLELNRHFSKMRKNKRCDPFNRKLNVLWASTTHP